MVQRCELRVTVSQQAGDDNILCSVFCATSNAGGRGSLSLSHFVILSEAKDLLLPLYRIIGFRSRNTLQRRRKRVKRERAQQVPAQSPLDFAEAYGGPLHPGEVGRFRYFFKFPKNVGIAH